MEMMLQTQNLCKYFRKQKAVNNVSLNIEKKQIYGLLGDVYKRQRAMWAGIAAMSTILPFMEDMHYRVRKRIVGNIAGVICFTVLYFLLPSSIYAYIGILGGIGVGFSAQYGWQAVFNTFGALALSLIHICPAYKSLVSKKEYIEREER